MGRNNVMQDLMLSSHSIEILLINEDQKIFSLVMIPKITSKLVLDITECKKIFWEDFIVYMQKLVSTRKEKER